MLKRKYIAFITRRGFARTFFMVKDYTCENTDGTKTANEVGPGYKTVTDGKFSITIYP